jgi:hypothetical protein
MADIADAASCVDGPRLARDHLACSADVGCSHVSGLLVQSGWTAGPNGVREPSPHHSNGIDVPMRRHVLIRSDSSLALRCRKGPSTPSFDHLISDGEHAGGDVEALGPAQAVSLSFQTRHQSKCQRKSGPNEAGGPIFAPHSASRLAPFAIADLRGWTPPQQTTIQELFPSATADVSRSGQLRGC